MFTGIIENFAEIISIEKHQSNLDLFLKSSLTPEFKIDQSLSHNGICLTIVEIQNDIYKVTAIAETIAKTSIASWQVGDLVNIERAMKLSDRLDGHIVQGHIDQVGICCGIQPQKGSTLFTFKYDTSKGNITIEKGSIAVNGVSLTVVNSQKDEFSVAIIPYTFEHTNFKNLKIDDQVNLEFDVIGKYVKRLTELHM